MATILDVSLLQSFDVIFVPILVFVILFALLQKTKALTDGVGINALISAVAALIILLSETAVKIVNFMVPWFAVAIIFLVLLLLIFQMFGAKDADILSVLKGDKAIIWSILGLGLLILLAAFGSVLGQSVGPYLGDGAPTAADGSTSVSSGNFETNVMATLFHPKVLGMLVIFGILIMAVFLLTQG